MSGRLILFQFAGRQVNMEVQWPYIERLLSLYPEMEVHLWDLTRDPADQRYLQTLQGAHDHRVSVLSVLHPGHPIACLYPDGYPGGSPHKPRGWRRCECMIHKPPYEQVYKMYAAAGPTSDQDRIYVKVDDDVLFLETERFDDLLAPVVFHPERIVSANVINNAVCAKYAEDAQKTADRFALGWIGERGCAPSDDKGWWELHTKPMFANWAHENFLRDAPDILSRTRRPGNYVRTRPGEAISINCIAFSHVTMVKIAGMMNDKLGDEGAVDRCLPWIASSFHAAHLAFGEQERQTDPDYLSELRGAYTQLRKDYLG